ncbi:uncharacterized protein A4U43_C04F4600 [Asparagus officinalis]|uniref:Uncharacterized protein n=1 Tax=Asparagus officinalis TaxID=4686 RepID=A0A5P1EY85_ASPOF|nr:uncharacterized protein A4U43_C04F4600 [Asparagus officinalis]
MKFKAFLTLDGVALLDKRFLPSLDKIGRTCHLYLTRTEDPATARHPHKPPQRRRRPIHPPNSERLPLSATPHLQQLRRPHRPSSSTPPSSTRVQQRRSGAGSVRSGETAAIQIKLVKKLTRGVHQPGARTDVRDEGAEVCGWFRMCPSRSHCRGRRWGSMGSWMLLRTCRSFILSLSLSRSTLQRGIFIRSINYFLPTLVQVPDLAQLQNLVDRLKNVGDLLTVAITQYGDLHLQVSTSLITVGSEFRRLKVLGVHADAPAGDQNLSAPTRTDMAIQRGQALSVLIRFKKLLWSKAFTRDKLLHKLPYGLFEHLGAFAFGFSSIRIYWDDHASPF